MSAFPKLTDAEIEYLERGIAKQAAELAEAQEQVVALRGAPTKIAELQEGESRLYEGGRQRIAIAALSSTPPPVVPLEDVRPLVDAVKQCFQFSIHLSMAEQNLVSALAAFTAKHPLK
jgi:hypothetical protein